MIRFMQNHPVRTRLLAGFGILLALLAVLGGAALLKMAEVQDQLDDIALDNNAKTTQTEIMFDRTGQVAVLIRNIALMDDPAYATEQMQKPSFVSGQPEYAGQNQLSAIAAP